MGSEMCIRDRPQREDLDLAASAGNNNNNNNNQRFWWQEPPGKIIFVLFCFDTCRDEEKETQNINVVGKIQKSGDIQEAVPSCFLVLLCVSGQKSARDVGRT